MQFDQAIHIPEILQSGGVTVDLIEESARYNLRIKAAELTAFKKMTGLKLPAKINTSSETKGIICTKLGPDEWMVIAEQDFGPKIEKSLAKANEAFVCSITDVSHRNVGFTVSGPDAGQLINVGCPLDLSLAAFPIGKAARTLFESTQITLFRTGEESFHLECWRSFGPYLRDYFERIVSTR